MCNRCRVCSIRRRTHTWALSLRLRLYKIYVNMLYKAVGVGRIANWKMFKGADKSFKQGSELVITLSRQYGRPILFSRFLCCSLSLFFSSIQFLFISFLFVLPISSCFHSPSPLALFICLNSTGQRISEHFFQNPNMYFCFVLLAPNIA